MFPFAKLFAYNAATSDGRGRIRNIQLLVELGEGNGKGWSASNNNGGKNKSNGGNHSWGSWGGWRSPKLWNSNSYSSPGGVFGGLVTGSTVSWARWSVLDR